MGSGPSKDEQTMKSREWNGAGHTAVVTGPMGNGIGFHSARWLAERGCHVVLAGRNAERLDECANQIRAACKAADGSALPAEAVQLTPIVLDLTSLRSVEQFAAGFQALGKPLNILLNNAGVMDTPYSQTKDGFELQMGTNHVGHFYLTQLLLPQLEAGAPSRIVNVASMGHKMANMSLEGLESGALFHPTAKQYSGWPQYGNSKLSNILFARSLQTRYAARGVTAYSLHPGVVATELGRQGKLNTIIYKGFSFMMKTAESGAGTSIHCATSPEALKDAGGYFDCCAPSVSVSKKATDLALAEALWNKTEQEIAAWKARPQAEIQVQAAPAAAAAAAPAQADASSSSPAAAAPAVAAQ